MEKAAAGPPFLFGGRFMDTSTAIVLATFLLYVMVPGYLLFFRGWPLRAGFAMLAIAQIPLAWQVYLTDSEALGFGLLLVLMLPLPLLLIGIGAVAAIVRIVRRGTNQSPS
jgi:hypothetical protein